MCHLISFRLLSHLLDSILLCDMFKCVTRSQLIQLYCYELLWSSTLAIQFRHLQHWRMTDWRNSTDDSSIHLMSMANGQSPQNRCRVNWSINIDHLNSHYIRCESKHDHLFIIQWGGTLSNENSSSSWTTWLSYVNKKNWIFLPSFGSYILTYNC